MNTDVYRSFLTSCVLLFSAILLSLPLLTFAQVGIDTGGYLQLSPTYPKPNEEVAVSLELYSVSLHGASIRWSINGVSISDADNARSIVFTTGPFGTKHTVRATVTPQNGGPITVQTTVIPSQIDLIVEADTRTPSFYKGRALPASDEPVTVTAITHIPGYTNTSGLMYKWTLGNTVLFGGAVRGKSTATFTMPKRQSLLILEVIDANGSVLGGEAVDLQPTTPELYFYEDNPLRGIAERAIGNTLTIIDTETTVRAEPYFVAKDIFDVQPITKWTIDGQSANYGEDIRTLTLRSEGGGGEARIGFSLVHPQSFLQTVEDTFTIHFE